jgi:hypothetical protein
VSIFDEPIRPNRSNPLTAPLWRELHQWALTCTDPSSTWLVSWLARVPCAECRISGANWIKDNPPSLPLFDWSVKFHNYVNVERRVREWTVDEALEIYKPKPNANPVRLVEPVREMINEPTERVSRKCGCS